MPADWTDPYGLKDLFRYRDRLDFAVVRPNAHAKITQVEDPEPTLFAAGRLLFKVAEAQEARLTDIWRVRHMLRWLGVVLDGY